VGKLQTRVGKRKNFSALCADFCPPWPETLPARLLGGRSVYCCYTLRSAEVLGLMSGNLMTTFIRQKIQAEW